MIETLYLIKPRGFCAGVVRAIDIVERALSIYGPPVYVRKEIVHNPIVVNDLREMGAVFVESLKEVPSHSVVIFSAHGVAPDVYDDASRRGLNVIDATCPLVTKVHIEARRFAKEGRTILLIGHEGHDEVIGTMGEAPDQMVLIQDSEDLDQLDGLDPANVAFLTQTTLSVDDTRDVIDAVRERYPEIKAPAKDDICYATQNRQEAVKAIAPRVDLLLVVGAANSSNSLRLVEVAKQNGVRAHRIDRASEIIPEWLDGIRSAAITAGASTPERLVQEVADVFRERGVRSIEDFEMVQENVVFPLPKELDVETVAEPS
ncbi:MAG: 4-hydroxy-3-methylbut-2-enyl diphosphate reductase [Blastocatellia bacterium]|mgnify:CR=1 FL=1|jgi:4-hydroxy-3-methylbut-2-enyl diphosphate reductase|nr:4-hydroxy-3-methylbut-2-enyl diphosphate reductase [Blastocatellia bacterium]